ncbi:MAG: hypothetical protein WBZ51_36610, partial [Xanthobacteraceae bacterium]
SQIVQSKPTVSSVGFPVITTALPASRAQALHGRITSDPLPHLLHPFDRMLHSDASQFVLLMV